MSQCSKKKKTAKRREAETSSRQPQETPKQGSTPIRVNVSNQITKSSKRENTKETFLMKTLVYVLERLKKLELNVVQRTKHGNM